MFKSFTSDSLYICDRKPEAGLEILSGVLGNLSLADVKTYNIIGHLLKLDRSGTLFTKRSPLSCARGRESVCLDLLAETHASWFFYLASTARGGIQSPREFVRSRSQKLEYRSCYLSVCIAKPIFGVKCVALGQTSHDVLLQF